MGHSMGYCWGRMPDFRYRSFISYSHRDEPWGKWLQRCDESEILEYDPRIENQGLPES